MKKIHSLSGMLLLAVLSFTFTICAKSETLSTYAKKLEFGPQLIGKDITITHESDRSTAGLYKYDTIWIKKVKKPKLDKHFRMGYVRAKSLGIDVVGKTYQIKDVQFSESNRSFTLILEDSTKGITYMKMWDTTTDRDLGFQIRDAEVINQLKGKVFVDAKSGNYEVVADCYYYHISSVYLLHQQVKFESGQTVPVPYNTQMFNYLSPTGYKKLRAETGSYKMVLSDVVKPASGEFSKGKSSYDENTNIISYVDNYVAFKIIPGESSFEFELKNISKSTLGIDWDDIIYIDVKSESQRVIHSGVKYKEANNPQQPSLVAKNSSIKDSLVPTNLISWAAWKNEWEIRSLLNQSKIRGYYEGKQVQLVFPIRINDVSYEYTFVFDLVWKWSYPQEREKWLRLQEENKQNVN